MDALTRHTTMRFTLQPTAAQEQNLWRHAGAARFGFNQALRIVKDGLEARKADANVQVPWSGFDLINAFNRWKRSSAAGVDERGNPGLPWRGEVTQQVFEEAAVDLGRGLQSFSSRRKAGSRAAGFPRFKKRSDPRQSFRIRNKTTGGKATIEIGSAGQVRSIRLPKIGVLVVRECTRKLRRMLRRERAKILFATISHHTGGRWIVCLNLEAAALHPGAAA